jgi:hypothetical protein
MRYQGIGEIGEGLVSVKVIFFWGYINLKNEMVIEPKYNGAYEFRNGKY